MGLWVKARHMWGSHHGELSRRIYHEEEGVPRGEDDEEGAISANYLGEFTMKKRAFQEARITRKARTPPTHAGTPSCAGREFVSMRAQESSSASPS